MAQVSAEGAPKKLGFSMMTSTLRFAAFLTSGMIRNVLSIELLIDIWQDSV